jgi:hypothetical protein
MLLIFLAITGIMVAAWVVTGFPQPRQEVTMLLTFLVAMGMAVVGWMATGFALLASQRVDDVNPFWFRSDIRAVGFVMAIFATLGASLIGRWWWALAILVTAPNLAAVAIMVLTPRTT